MFIQLFNPNFWNHKLLKHKLLYSEKLPWLRVEGHPFISSKASHVPVKLTIFLLRFAACIKQHGYKYTNFKNFGAWSINSMFQLFCSLFFFQLKEAFDTMWPFIKLHSFWWSVKQTFSRFQGLLVVSELKWTQPNFGVIRELESWPGNLLVLLNH